ncbi:AI-2E family transporter [Candidatus Saccharibacteria bacterium]|nr:AI-2E family transporter [Candidatus Saccharibacteria bacterium]
MGKQIEVDTRTFIRFWLVLLGIGLIILFLYKALTGLIIIGISIFLALALKPLVSKLNNFLGKHFGMEKNHKTASAVIAYSIIVTILVTVVIIVGPVVVNETAKFVQNLPNTIQDFNGWDGINNFGKGIGIDNLQTQILEGATSLSKNIFGNIGNTVVTSISTIADILTKGVLILILTLLFLLEGPGIMEHFWKSLSARKEDARGVSVAKHIFNRMSNVVSTYVSHQALVALIDGLSVALFVFILSLIFNFSAGLAIPMGLMAALFYLIPMFGQIISVCLVVVILAISSPVAAIIFALVYIIYAQIENNVIAPKIQGSALKLPAVVILGSMIIGMYMFGLLGAIIAIPIAGCIRVLIEEYPKIKSA